MEVLARLANLPGALPGACAQGLIWGIMAIGVFCSLSFGPLADVKFFGKTIFDLLDYLTSNVGMPFAALGLAIVAAWVNWPTTRHQLTTAKVLSPMMLTCIRVGIGVVSPAVIIIVVMRSL